MKVDMRRQHDLDMVWHTAILQRMDAKHFPKDPRELWESPEKLREMNEQSLLAEMQTLKSQKDTEVFVKKARERAAAGEFEPKRRKKK